MKPRIILQSEGVVNVRFDHSACDVFLSSEKLPISDIELIELVRKYHKMTQKSRFF